MILTNIFFDTETVDVYIAHFYDTYTGINLSQLEVLEEALGNKPKIVSFEDEGCEPHADLLIVEDDINHIVSILSEIPSVL